MSEQENQQVQQPTKKKGGWLKGCSIGCGGLLLLIILMGGCVALFAPDTDETTDTTDEVAENEETSESDSAEEAQEEDGDVAIEESDANEQSDEEVTEEAESPDAEIGDTLDVGDISYTVNDVYTTTEVGPSILPETANEMFIVIEMDVTNNGTESVTVDSNFFKIVIDDATFDADSMGSMSANQDESGEITNSFFLENLNPGSTLSGNIVFDVSEEYAENPEKILQVQEGLLGTNTGTINLQ